MNKLKKLVICAVTLCATTQLFALEHGYWWKNHDESQQAQKWFEGQVRKCLKPGKNPGQCLDKLFKGVPRCKNLHSVKDNQIPAWCWFDTTDYNDSADDPRGDVELESASQPGYYKASIEYIPSVYVTKAFGEVTKSYFALEGNPKYLDYKKMDDFYKKNKNTWAAYLMKDWVLYNDDVRCYALSVFIVKTLIPDIAHEEQERIAWYLCDAAGNLYLHGEGIEKWWWEAKYIYKEGVDMPIFREVKWKMFTNIVVDYAFPYYWLIYEENFWKNFAIAPIYKDPKVRAQQAKKVRDAIRKLYHWNKKNGYYKDMNGLRALAIKYGYWYSPKELANQKKIQEDNKRREVGFGISSHLRK